MSGKKQQMILVLSALSLLGVEKERRGRLKIKRNRTKWVKSVTGSRAFLNLCQELEINGDK